MNNLVRTYLLFIMGLLLVVIPAKAGIHPSTRLRRELSRTLRVTMSW